MALTPSKHRVTDADELTAELWNALVDEYGLALVGLLEKARTFDAAEAALISTALHRLDQALAPALAAAAEAAANFDPLNYYEREEIDAAIAAVVGEAPSGLNTLAKLAAAIGDTEDFAEGISAALDGKAAAVHGHAISDVAGLSTALNSKAASTHGHDMTAIQGLTAALAAKAVAGLIGSAGLTMATAKLLGRTTANIGAPEEIAVGGGVKLDAGALSVDKASTEDIFAGTSNKVLTADGIKAAREPVTVPYHASDAIGLNAAVFGNMLGMTGDRVLDFTNGSPGTTYYLRVGATTSTPRTVTFSSKFSGDLPTLNDITNTKYYLLSIVCVATNEYNVTAVVSKKP